MLLISNDDSLTDPEDSSKQTCQQFVIASVIRYIHRFIHQDAELLLTFPNCMMDRSNPQFLRRIPTFNNRNGGISNRSKEKNHVS